MWVFCASENQMFKQCMLEQISYVETLYAYKSFLLFGKQISMNFRWSFTLLNIPYIIWHIQSGSKFFAYNILKSYASTNKIEQMQNAVWNVHQTKSEYHIVSEFATDEMRVRFYKIQLFKNSISMVKWNICSCWIQCFFPKKSVYRKFPQSLNWNMQSRFRSNTQNIKKYTITQHRFVSPILFKRDFMQSA